MLCSLWRLFSHLPSHPVHTHVSTHKYPGFLQFIYNWSPAVEFLMSLYGEDLSEVLHSCWPRGFTRQRQRTKRKYFTVFRDDKSEQCRTLDKDNFAHTCRFPACDIVPHSWATCGREGGMKHVSGGNPSLTSHCYWALRSVLPSRNKDVLV